MILDIIRSKYFLKIETITSAIVYGFNLIHIHFMELESILHL